MIELTVPGRGDLHLSNLVMDVNGTLAVDGQLIDGVAKRLATLGDRLALHLLTADTHGRQEAIDRQLGLQAVRIPPGDEAIRKGEYVRQLDPRTVIAIGQGANDAAMLSEAALGICVLSAEGSAVKTLLAADLFIPGILDALDLLEKPMRIIASLRT